MHFKKVINKFSISKILIKKKYLLYFIIRLTFSRSFHLGCNRLGGKTFVLDFKSILSYVMLSVS